MAEARGGGASRRPPPRPPHLALYRFHATLIASGAILAFTVAAHQLTRGLRAGRAGAEGAPEAPGARLSLAAAVILALGGGVLCVYLKGLLKRGSILPRKRRGPAPGRDEARGGGPEGAAR